MLRRSRAPESWVRVEVPTFTTIRCLLFFTRKNLPLRQKPGIFIYDAI